MLIVDVLACADIMTSDSPHATTYKRIIFLYVDKVRMDMSSHLLYLRLIEIKAMK